MEFKLWSKEAELRDLAKHTGVLKEPATTVVNQFGDMTDEQLDAEIKSEVAKLSATGKENSDPSPTQAAENPEPVPE